MKRRRFDRRWFLLTVLLAVILALISCAPALAATGDGSAGSDLAANSPLHLWQLLAGFLIPAFVQVAKRRHWDDEASRAVAVGCALVATVLGLWGDGNLHSGIDWVSTMITIVITTQTSYELVYKSKLLAPLTAALGNIGGGPSTDAQRAGYQGKTTATPPPS